MYYNKKPIYLIAYLDIIISMARKHCSICGKEVKIPYKLDKYGIQGIICGSCYDEKLKEIYNIKH